MKDSRGTFILILISFVAFFFLYQTQQRRGSVKELAYSEFIESVNQVDRVIIYPQKIVGVISEKGLKISAKGVVSEEDLKLFKAAKIKYQYEYEKDSYFVMVLLNLMPFLLLMLLFFIIIRVLSKNAQGGGAGGFGNRHGKIDKVITGTTSDKKFNDVAGIDEIKEELVEVVDFLKNPEAYRNMGAKIPKGVLLVGPPGTGKTLLAKAVAGEAGVPFFSVSGSSFVEMFVGVGASRVRDLFSKAKEETPSIIFIDEIDAVGRKRGAGVGGGHDEREQTLNQLLVEMDGFGEANNTIVIASTNRPDILDPALTRPGRFDRTLTVSRPDKEARERILDVHLRNVKLDKGISVKRIASMTPGFSGADLENLVNESAILATRLGSPVVRFEHFEVARDRVTMGPEKKAIKMKAEQVEVTGYHEAGHALIALLEDAADPVYKVSVIPRGMALGVTQQMPTGDMWTMSKTQLIAQIRVLMGGRAAEELIYNEFTTGASNDIQRATSIARRMICEWGMSELGPINYSDNSGEVFLGNTIGRNSSLSPQKADQIDLMVETLLAKEYSYVLNALKENQGKLEGITKVLLDKETIGMEDVYSAAGMKLPEIDGVTVNVKKQEDEAIAVNVRAQEIETSEE